MDVVRHLAVHEVTSGARRAASRGRAAAPAQPLHHIGHGPRHGDDVVALARCLRAEFRPGNGRRTDRRARAAQQRADAPEATSARRGAERHLDIVLGTQGYESFTTRSRTPRASRHRHRWTRRRVVDVRAAIRHPPPPREF